MPSFALLTLPRIHPHAIDEDALRKSSQILETKLADFGIEGKVVEVRPGPVITTFDIEPAPGIKVNRIVSLGDDLAMALRVPGVRILAPVPGKAVVGIEVANPKRDEVVLREMIESDAFMRATSPLALALGKNTAGGAGGRRPRPMPHLLIAGATGSGKSVAINAMITSMLVQGARREDVRFVMIDPKMLELSVYEDIPHLLVPVVTDPKKAVVVLTTSSRRWTSATARCARRLHKMDGTTAYRRSAIAAPAVRSIELRRQTEPRPRSRRATLPYWVVVIIDELADLMMAAAFEVEEPICRLAQLARATGIHLIVATQRPSVDVITGLIKANFPTRIAFAMTLAGRLAHHPRHGRRRAPARPRRHALHAAGHGARCSACTARW